MSMPLITQVAIEQHLAAIAELFQEPKLTLIVRNPQFEDADVLMTNDDFEKAVEAGRLLHEKANSQHIGGEDE